MSWRDHARAVLVVLHLTAITLMALPAPGGGMSRAAWKDPTVQDEFAAWTARLNAVGVPWSSEELQDHAWDFAERFMAVRGAVLRPFGPYYKYCGTNQSWRMFVGPHRYPTKLWVSVERGGVWEPVYIERDPTRAWHGRQLDHDRFRSVIFRNGWPQYAKTNSQFADWLAKDAKVDFPDATRMRVAYWKQRTPTPAEARAGIEPEGKFERVETRMLRKR